MMTILTAVDVMARPVGPGGMSCSRGIIMG